MEGRGDADAGASGPPSTMPASAPAGVGALQARVLFAVKQSIIVSKNLDDKRNETIHTISSDQDQDIENQNEQTNQLHQDILSRKSKDLIGVEECTICFQTYQEGDIIAFSENQKCLHYTHVDCITKWLMEHDSCPSCRHDYFVTSEIEAGDDV